MRAISSLGFGIGDQHFFNQPPPPAPPPLIWTPIASPSSGEALVGITTNGLNLFTADDLGNVFTSGDGGHTWVLRNATGFSGFGNLRSPGNSRMIIGGNGSPLGLSNDSGGTWAAVTGTTAPLNSFIVVPNNSGNWAGWTNNGSGSPNSHSASADGGATWTTPVSTLPFNTGIGEFSPGALGFDGANFFACTSTGVYASGDGLTWFLQSTPHAIASMSHVGTKYIAGDATLGVPVIYSSTTISGLATAPAILTPFSAGSEVHTIAGVATKFAYVCASDLGEVANAIDPAAPWTLGNLHFQPSEECVEIIFDTVHNNFVAVGIQGSVSLTHLP